MARRGPKPKPDALKIVRRTFKPSRSYAPVVSDVTGDVNPPTWLKGDALKLWHAKVATYAVRGQSVVGCEGTLAAYCQIEADLIARWKQNAVVTAASINAYRVFAAEVFDTPSSRLAIASTAPTPSNRFSRNVHPWR